MWTCVLGSRFAGEILRRPERKDCTVVPRTWSGNRSNQILYHNESLKACRVSTREISKRRALFQDTGVRPPPTGQQAGAAVAIGREFAERPSSSNPTTGEHRMSSRASKLSALFFSMGRGSCPR